ncbi:zinc ribbon domain-containing protein [Candidatus Woesearchaeota archaeon]|nr:zinc ribbon domain-containing protein [Candidatus Woesearchaeota archaeon]
MVSIPGWAYSAVGVAIALYSKFVQSRSPDNKVMAIFFWVGVVFIIVGAFKLATQFLLGNRKKEQEATPRAPDGRPAAARDMIFCPRCNAKLHPQSKYCNWCGTQV